MPTVNTQRGWPTSGDSPALDGELENPHRKVHVRYGMLNKALDLAGCCVRGD
jgi:hypothetical protein